MIGKLLGAWIGKKLAGENQGTKGAIIGYGTAVVAKRVVPTIVAAAALGWVFRTWRERKRSHPAYPLEATPRIPPSDTRSPS